MTASRKQFRTDLKEELAALIMALASSADFYRYEPASYKGHTPVVYLSSEGAEHIELTKAINDNYFVYANLLTLYKDKGGAYTEEAGMDALDELHMQFVAAVQTKRVVAAKWQKLTIEGRSMVLKLDVGGELYFWEQLLLRGSMF